MALCIIKKVINKLPISTLRTSQLLKNYSLYTPDYLETMKPKFPHCPVINVQIKGYSYPILENYQKLIDSIATHMDIDVDDSYALPAKKLKIDRLKPNTTVVEVTYILELYERNMQFSHLPCTRLPIFVRLLEAAVPEGVTLNIEVWDPEQEEHRYVPDTQLLGLKEELDTLQGK